MLKQTRQPCKLFLTKFIRLVYCSHVIAYIKVHVKRAFARNVKVLLVFSGICFPIDQTFSYYWYYLHRHKPFKIITTSTAYNLTLRAVSCDIVRYYVRCYQTECRLLQSWTKLVETTFPSIPNKYPLYNKFHVESCCAPFPYPNSNSMLSLRHCKLPRIVSAVVELGKQVRRKF